jgi:hypothetical protein
VSATSQRTLRNAAILLCICGAYLFNVQRWHPETFFGRFHDDSLYFSSAKALSQGQGYVIPSFPGAPPQTKYPIVLPWLLSWIWKWNPSFPQNLTSATWIIEFFGVWALIASFLLLKKLPGIGEKPALLLTGLLAFQPIFIRMSGLLMADVPFMALMLTAFLLADEATTREGRVHFAVITGVVAGLGMGLRSVGIAVVAGFFLLALSRRAFRQALLFAAAAAVVFVAESWPTLMHHPVTASAVASTSAGGPGWQQLSAYYTSYGVFWRMSVPSVRALFDLARANFLSIVSSPGSFLVAPLETRWSLISSVLTVPIGAGIIRQFKNDTWRPIPVVLAIYLAILLVWPWAPERFLLPFLTIFFAGLWIEARRMAPILTANLRRSVPTSQRLIAGALAALLAAVLSYGAWNFFVRDPGRLKLASTSLAANRDQREQAYAWLRLHTDPSARITAYEDAVLYLYTARQSLRPIAFLPESGYMEDQSVLSRDLDHIADAPRYAGARYWLATDDDFYEETYSDAIRIRLRQIEGVLPLLFQSADGSVRVHDATCMVESHASGCQAAASVLFPYEEKLPAVGNNLPTKNSEIEARNGLKSGSKAMCNQKWIGLGRASTIGITFFPSLTCPAVQSTGGISLKYMFSSTSAKWTHTPTVATYMLLRIGGDMRPGHQISVLRGKT